MKNRIVGNTLLSFLLCFVIASAAIAQESVESLRNRAGSLRKEIEKKEAILLSSQKDVNSRLANLKTIAAKIGEYKGYVELLKKEVNAIDGRISALDKEMSALDKDIKACEGDVEQSRAEYAQALRAARLYNNSRNRLMFIFSADDFNTMARRYRYANQHMDAHKVLADSLKSKIEQLGTKRSRLEEKRRELEGMRAAKQASLKEQQQERERIQKLEKEQRGIVASLQKENKKVQAELKKKRNELNKLNAAIKREVEKVVAAEAEKERKRKEKEMGSSKKSSKGGKENKPADKSAYSKESAVSKMSGKFESNKGRMPVPITGSYLLVDKFGERNALTGTKGSVMINNGGITFKGTKGAKARCVFEGVVSTVFYHNDYVCVLVRHDKYISVYCNVENVCVKSGDRVKAGDVLGDVMVDAADGNPLLLFQLYREKTLLNPTGWLKM
ncbi:MAG: peptidoglycan DD-metalloendopeptidase family protein [Bacteroidaceae bacterium]|nr:peptidoglycan DD-metalloendopeptidase family protein [Bacteroidaceae bacterium]